VQLSSIREAGLLATIMMDCSISSDDRHRAYTHAGCAGLHFDAPANHTIVPENLVTAAYNRSGAKIMSGTTLKIGLAIPNLIGTLSLRAIPVGLLRDQLRLVIKLKSNPNGWGVGPEADLRLMTVSDVKLHLSIIKLNHATEMGLMKMSNGVMKVPCVDYQTYSVSVASNAGRISYQIPHRTRSISAIFVVARESTKIDTPGNHTLINRIKPFASYSFRIGSARVPQIDVDCTGTAPEAFLELQRAFGLVNMSETPTVLPASVYSTTGFVLGVALSAFNQTDTLADGVSTESVNLVFDATLNPVTPAMVLDFFVAYENVLHASQGQLRFER
jgi:hypothetical protein